MVRLLLVLLSILISNSAFGQGEYTLFGKITDEERNPLSDVVILENGNVLKFTNVDGEYEIRLKANRPHKLVFSFQLTNKTIGIPAQIAGIRLKKNLQFITTANLPMVGVEHKRKREKPSVITMDPRLSVDFPVVQFEDVLTKIGLGVSQAGGELSSAYNVRGGNFDENLVYVNGIEIYRPFLVRSGQQEGLSFINADMTEKVEFSAGGFEAKYGDKLSSVLDVTYIDPESFGAGVTLSFMGANVFAHDVSEDKRFSYNVGVRYRTNQYLLNSLDVTGSYRPNFTDIQSLLSYRLTSKLKAQWLTSYSRNSFLLVPESRSTSFGTIQSALRLFVAFGGSELTQFSTFVNGLNLEYQWNDSNRVVWTSSIYSSDQIEHFTIEGAYRLDELENNLGSDNFGESRLTLGVGYFINHARNDLNILVHNHQLRGIHYRGKNNFEWGVKFQEERVDDRLKEWNYNDSAGYNVAADRSTKSIELDEVLNTNIDLNGFRVSGYGQWSRTLSEKSDMRISAGVRTNYWSVNEQTIVSPRAQFSFKPNKAFNDRIRSKYEDIEVVDSLKKRDWVIKCATGFYQQPPFYRELRDIKGVLNTELRAQKAIHMVLGGDMLFEAWDRPFRFIGEMYYKALSDIVPYYLDNVRIRYDAVNGSRGYSTGMDLRVNGEFIKGLESWFNVSLLSTRERIDYELEGTRIKTGNIRRPTDQRFNASILFQDELKMDPTFKMHLNLVFGTGLPYYFNGPFRYTERFNIPPYRRVDIGFSKELIDFEKKMNERRVQKLSSLWFSLEVFNLLQVNNTISYIWVQDLNNNLYGVPNYLTGRRINLKMIARI